MIDGIPRISVLVITYNQEDVIGRAIESLLSQKDYIFEICISDDCSKDKTWEILNYYSSQYPGLFVLNRNDPNVGIFENIERTWEMPTGDIVYQLSGDDECGYGWFQKVIDSIKELGLDYKNEMFCVYGDYMTVDLKGRKITHKNNLVTKDGGGLSLAIRGIVCNRSTCYSIKVLNRFFKVSQGRSHIAESAQDRQLQLFSEKNYYIPYVGNIYHTGIGVSTRIANDIIFEERKQINQYLINSFADRGFAPSKADLRYFVYEDAFLDFLHKKTLKNAFKLIYRWLLSYDKTIGMRSLNLSFMISHFIKLFQ